MNLKNAKIGQKYRLYITSEGKVIGDIATKNTIVGTVIAEGIDNSMVLFGWKKGEDFPDNSKSRGGLNLSGSYKYGKDQMSYDHSLSIRTDAVVHSKIAGPGEYDGCQCKKCHNFYPYAEPNQEDGTLVCYSCRTSW